MAQVISFTASQELLEEARPYADAEFNPDSAKEDLKKIIEDAEMIARQRGSYRHANEVYAQQPVTYRGNGAFQWTGSVYSSGLLRDQFLTMCAKKCMLLP